MRKLFEKGKMGSKQKSPLLNAREIYDREELI